MRVLVVGKQNMLFWAENLHSAFRHLGNNSELFLINKLPGIFEPLRLASKVFATTHTTNVIKNAFRRCIALQKPELIVFVSASFIPEYLFELAKQNSNATLAGWIGDNIMDDSMHKIKMLDNIFITDSGFEKILKSKGFDNIKYLPLAFNPLIFHSTQESPRNSEVIFIGGYSAGRAKLLDELKESITVVGKSWKNYKTNVHNVIPKNISMQEVKEYYESYGAVLNIKQETNVISGLAMRVFEASASGALVIHDDVADLRRNFETDKEILAYSTPDELNIIVKNFKKNPADFKHIAIQGQSRSIHNHKYENRIIEFTKLLTAVE